MHVCEADVFQFLQYNHACISVLVNFMPVCNIQILYSTFVIKENKRTLKY